MSSTSFDHEDEEQPHMLAVDSGDDVLHDDDLDPDEEMMLMHTKEAMGNTTPPPLTREEEEEDEPAFIPQAATNANTSGANTSGAVDDSFESYIFDSDGSEDFQTRGRNHVIPVINSSPTKQKRPPGISSIMSDGNQTDPSTSPQSPDEKSPENGLFGRTSSFGMYISPPSSSEYGASPTSAAEARPPPALEDPLTAGVGNRQSSLPHFRYSSPPTIQTPPVMKQPTHAQSAPPFRPHSAPVIIPDGTTPVVLDSPPGYRRPSNVEQSTKSTRRSSSNGSARSNRNNKAFIWGMSKPVFCILAFYLLFMTGSFIYFVYQYVQIPSLKEQVETLSAEVDRLSAEVDELESLIDEFNSTLYALEIQVTDLQLENNKLATQNAILEEQNDTFTNQTDVLEERIDELQGTVQNLTLANEALKEEAFALELLNGELTNLTLSLNATNVELEARAENLTAVNDELVQSNEALTNQTDALQANLGELVLEFNEAYETVIELEDQVGSLQEENDRLSNLTEALATVLSFLEETNQDADLTVEQLAGQLEEQITNNRVLVLETLENTLTQRTQSWNCDYNNEFAGSSFAQDYNVPIPSGSYDSVIDYVETRVLMDLCLDRADFELYLSVNFMPNGDGLTSNELISGVSMYTTDALNFYFPDSGETGVTPEEWAEASYDCANLPPERQYQL